MLIVVPARAGSRGLPGKNTARFHGAALVDWSLAAAAYLQARIDGTEVVCSSDDADVLALAAAWPGVALRDRPADLASDTAGMAGVVLDARAGAGRTHERYVLLQPTSPLRLCADLVRFAALARGPGAVVSVTKPAEAPEDIVHLPGCTALVRDATVRRQDRESRFGFVDGSLYSGEFADLEAGHGFLPDGRTAAMMQDMPRAVDIDTGLDWQIALALHDWLLAEEMAIVTPGRQ